MPPISSICSPTQKTPPPKNRLAMKASRPALIDLRFTGDAWVVEQGEQAAAVCLGDYALSRLAVSPLDVPSLNRTLAQVRTGQARRNQARHQRK